jgi:hypothetical protein
LVKEAMKAAGADCGCDGRQKWLNARFPYSPAGVAPSATNNTTANTTKGFS